MAVIKPITALDTDTDLAPTQDNFPSLMHFFQCKETGGTSLTDIAGGVTVTTAATITNPATGAILASVTAAAPASGTIASGTGTKTLVTFIVGDPNTLGAVTFGDGSASGQNIVTQTGTILSVKTVDDGSTTVSNSAAAVSTETAYGFGAIAVPGSPTGLDAYEVDATSGYSVLTPAGLQDLSGITTLALGNRFSTANMSSIYGIALFAFTTLPGDIEEALTWMRVKWLANEKVIWPGWKNRT